MEPIAPTVRQYKSHVPERCVRDQYRALLLASFKDARAIVGEYNEWGADEFGDDAAVPPQAVPRITLALYQSRVMEAILSGSFKLPEFDERMYE